MDEIIQLINGVGFPIACCVVLFIQQGQLRKSIEQNTATLKELSDNLKANPRTPS